MATECHPSFQKLGESNDASWVGDMHAHLMTKEVWGLVKGVDVQPDITEKAELKQWCKDCDSAAGEIYMSLESSQKVHVKGLEE